jgi:hypothetical protein
MPFEEEGQRGDKSPQRAYWVIRIEFFEAGLS